MGTRISWSREYAVHGWVLIQLVLLGVWPQDSQLFLHLQILSIDYGKLEKHKIISS